MKITIDEFARKNNVPVRKVEEFLKFLKIDPNVNREFEEEKLQMFLKMMR